VGFKVCICEQPGWPDAEVQVEGKLTIAEVMRAVLASEPKVVSVSLVQLR
jgi:hypothetical protein